MSTNEVIEFYDPFYAKRENLVINDRVYYLFKRAKKAGINTHSSVIELGCGAGGMTFLLSKVVKRGIIEAVDISPVAIGIARQNCSAGNIHFNVADILTFMPQYIEKADFITLFDVLEHVPPECHDALIGRLSSLMHAESTLLINIPNPRHIEYDAVHNPSLLQIIDQPVQLSQLVALLVKYSLSLRFMEIYGVWNQCDYQFFLIKKDKTYDPVPLKEKLGLFQRVKRKCERVFVKFFYKYPPHS